MCRRGLVSFALLAIAAPAVLYAQGEAGLKGGVSFGNISNKGVLPGNLGTRTGFAGGIYLGYRVGFIGVGLEGLYARRGAKSDSSFATAQTRLDPRFNQIQEVQSIGESTFKSMTVSASKRYANGLSMNVQYSLGKGLDNTPLLTQLTVQSEQGRSDPSNLDRDKGPNPLDMRHNLSGNIVYTSINRSSNGVVRALLDGNQIGVLLQLNSSLPINIRSNLDLNGDGVASDRPLNVARNSLYLPNRYNVDMRYTRMVPIHGSVRAELIAEMKNVFNTEQMANFNSVVTTDSAGNPVVAIPGDPYGFPSAVGYEQRKFQLGFKVRF